MSFLMTHFFKFEFESKQSKVCLFFVQVEFSVKDYRPEELSIKTEGDVLIVMGKHETKSEGGSSFISKQFEQKFSLPSGVPWTEFTHSTSKYSQPTECICDLTTKLGVVVRWIFMCHFWPLVMWVTFFGVVGSLVKIGVSLKQPPLNPLFGTNKHILCLL